MSRIFFKKLKTKTNNTARLTNREVIFLKCETFFLNLTYSPNVLLETRRKWQISPLQSFPTMTNGRTALNPTGRECCWATKPLWPDEAWLMKEWKSGCEGIQPQSHEEVNGTPAITVWNTQAGGASPILRHEKTEETEEKVSLWRVFQPRKLTSTPPLRFLRWSYVFVLCLYTIWWIIQCCNPIAKQQETHCMWYKIRCRQEKEKVWVCGCVGEV